LVRDMVTFFTDGFRMDNVESRALNHRWAMVNGTRFHVVTAGSEDAPPILFLHGFPEGWMSWRAVMDELREYRVCAPDLRGYPDTDRTLSGYDVFTLTDDIKGLIESLNLDRPAIVSHDWGGALGWIFAHRYSSLISNLIVVNCTHPKTLMRAVLHFQDCQTFRSVYALVFQIPFLPEFVFTTFLGRKLLELSCMLLEGNPNMLNREVLKEMLSRFGHPGDLRGPINYYRQLLLSHIVPSRRELLEAVYRTPITVPATLVWGEKDWVLSESVAKNSYLDAGCPVDFRSLPGVGHFVELEAPALLAAEIRRALNRC
jgi:pimeloyl-ACP methyl ester carboxylesterase